MGRRKKARIMAFETLCPDSQNKPTWRTCRNFICTEDKVKDCIVGSMRKEAYKKDIGISRDIETLLSFKTELRNGIGNIGDDMVALGPVELNKSIKTTTPYIYRVIDYTQAKAPEIYGTKKDALDIIQKKIKTKNAIVCYNGTRDRIEFNIDEVSDILTTLEDDTIDFDICTVGRGDVEGDILLVTIFKNGLGI